MRNIVDEVGEIIAKATDEHTVIGGHHRLAVAASLGRKLFWKDTGEPVKLDPYFKGSSDRNTACRQRDATGVRSRSITSMLPSSCI
jgi:hypothetical protein